MIPAISFGTNFQATFVNGLVTFVVSFLPKLPSP